MAPALLLTAPVHCALEQKTFSKSKHNLKSSQPILFSDTWPQVIENAWDGASFQDESLYTLRLSEGEIHEVQDALQHFKSLCLDGHKVATSNFPLPSLEGKLKALSQELHNGRGFFALRGFNINAYSPEDNLLIFLGISSYIADIRGKQNDRGEMIAHLMNAKNITESQDQRPVRYSKLGFPFHTDMFVDILAVQTRSCAASGGSHIISSSNKIYNELVNTRPDLIEVLKQDWCFDAGNNREPEIRPLLFHEGGRIIMQFVKQPLVGLDDVPRPSNLPKPTSLQLQALKVVQALAEKYSLRLNMLPGDLTFINNLCILHSREAFEDDEIHKRYLIRLWLKNKDLAWQLPKSLESGNRHIYMRDEEDDEWNIYPAPNFSFDIRERFYP